MKITNAERDIWDLKVRVKKSPGFSAKACQMMLEDEGKEVWFDLAGNRPVMEDKATGKIDISPEKRIVTYWIDRFSHVPTGVNEAVMSLALEHKRNPVADWLDGLVWDGMDHVGELIEIADIDQRDRAKLENWLAECALAAHNGPDIECKPDKLMVLVGPSGCGKTLLGSRLRPRKLRNHVCNMPGADGTKDLVLFLTAYWLLQMQDVQMYHGNRLRNIRNIARKVVFEKRFPYSHFCRRCYSHGVPFFESAQPVDDKEFLVIHMGHADIDRLAKYDVTQVWAQVMHDMEGGI